MTTLERHVEDLVDRAQARIAADGFDPATVLGAALEALAEQWAEDERPWCHECRRHRVNRRGADRCTWCEQKIETQLLHKIRWYQKNAESVNAGKRAARAEAAADRPEDDDGDELVTCE